MTSHLNSHRTTDIKPEMLSGVQTRNGTPHDKYNIRGIAHARTNRKYDIFMQRGLVQNFTFILEGGQGTHSLTKHTLGIFPVFFPCMQPTPLCVFFFTKRVLKKLLLGKKIWSGAQHKYIPNYDFWSRNLFGTKDHLDKKKLTNFFCLEVDSS